MKQLIIYTILSLLLTGSLSAKKLSKTDLAFLYDENKFTDFQAVIYHTSDTLSTVYMNIRLHDFNFIHDTNKDIHRANFKVFYELFSGYDSKHALDTATLIFTDTLSYGTESEMIVDFDVKASFPYDYVLKITLFDLNRKKDNYVYRFYNIQKNNKYSRQNFLVKDSDGYPVFCNYILQDQYFRILYNNPGTHLLHIRYYNRKFPLAKPPFAVEKKITYKFEPDSLYTITLTGGESQLLDLPDNGICHFQADTAQTNGLTLFRFDDGFPEIASPLQAILPLRYLTTQKEFDKLLSYSDHKTAVDSFWLERSSNIPKRAINMIQRYYNRVQNSNIIFTSYQEGWKTDRGIIYIIYGPPSEVYLNSEEEEWIYGERGNPLSIKFYFNKVDNPFTDNDYSLIKSPVYKNSWYIAIENWRR